LLEITEENRARGTRLRTRRLLSDFLPVVTERALERAAVIGPAIDDAERARHDAIAAAVAHIRLHIDAAEFGPDDGARRTGLQASRILAMLADIGRELPRHVRRRIAAVSRVRLALDELHMAPRGVAESRGVVVRERREDEAVGRDFVPLLARDFARLAADAERRVREKTGDRHSLHSRPDVALRHIAGESLRLEDLHVGLFGDRQQIVDDVS